MLIGTLAVIQIWNAPHRSAEIVRFEDVGAHNWQVRAHLRATSRIATWGLLPAPAFRLISQTEKSSVRRRTAGREHARADLRAQRARTAGS